MGRILLVLRLVLTNVRHHPGQAAMLLVAITAATAAFSLGASLPHAGEVFYQRTWEATAGPDVAVFAPDDDQESITALEAVAASPEVAAHSGPHPEFHTELTAHGSTSRAVVQTAPTEPGPVDRPLVTSGTWVREGGVVVERGLANAHGIRVGDEVTVADRALPVVGTAVTAARTPYPFAMMMGPGGGPTQYSGLVWMSEADTRELAADGVSATAAVFLTLDDPAAEAFVDSAHSTSVKVHAFSREHFPEQHAVLFRDSRPSLVVGGWLLGFMAATGVATVTAGRVTAQIRRVGLLRAVGAGPGLIAAVLFTEYLLVALVAAAAGLGIAALALPAMANPTASLIGGAAAPSAATIVAAVVIALVVAGLATLDPTVRALRAGTVGALAGTAHAPRHRAWLTRLSALLPTPLLLGLRLISRRPGRAVLHACSVMVTLFAAAMLMVLFVQPVVDYGVGDSHLSHVRADQGRHALVAITAALIVLAAVNTVTITWATALEARRATAIARTLGATPGQVAAGLSIAQLLPVLPGAAAGILLGTGFPLLMRGADATTAPGAWLLTAALVAPLVTVALTALPARIAARRPVAHILSAEAV